MYIYEDMWGSLLLVVSLAETTSRLGGGDSSAVLDQLSSSRPRPDDPWSPPGDPWATRGPTGML